MPSYEHKRIADEIRTLDRIPEDKEKFNLWIQAGGHLDFLRQNAQSNEVVIYANGEYTFAHAAVVPNSVLETTPMEDLTSWDGSPYNSYSGYAYGGGRNDVWIERQGEPSEPRRELDQAIPLLHVRTFEGWSGIDRNYVELNPLYTHVTGIHWRRERRAYCRYNGDGDLEDVVSVTMRSDAPNDLNCVTFTWRPLEEFLAAMNATLVRRYDFTLLRRGSFSGWADGGPELIRESKHLAYRQLVMPGHAAYTTGIQLIPLRRATQQIFDDIRGGRREKQYAEFIAMDWRNKRNARISTDPAATTNYFEAKKNSLAFELSPAFFRPEVILKYKADKDKYTVGERDISCRAAWHLQGIDVNAAGQVFAYLCYLRNLPYSEQLHWQSFNEEPKAGLSERAITNDFEGKFVMFREPLQEILSIVRDWRDKKVAWWTLRDERLPDRVSTPLTSSRDEWAEAFLDLAKLVVEGFEVAAIRKQCDAAKIAYDAKEQSIGLLERLLGRVQGTGEKHLLPALRTVQAVRTRVKSHASGEGANELANDALAKHETFTNHFKNTCTALALELQLIASTFP